jgi:hypothetical protein
MKNIFKIFLNNLGASDFSYSETKGRHRQYMQPVISLMKVTCLLGLFFKVPAIETPDMYFS